MDLGLKNKRVIITGGTKGIGRSIADTFADEGADVAVFLSSVRASFTTGANLVVDGALTKGVQL
jgi:3-oxoacyl-[acyl-carrier protein] reductase